MPRRPPSPPRPPLTPRQAVVRATLVMIATVIATFLLSIAVVGNITYHASQQQLRDRFRAELADGTAPVSEGDFEDVLLADGAPVAIIDIPEIGLHDVVVEGTSGATLMDGPGHRRDTVLPGQVGVSVIMGRSFAYGGPFGSLSHLAPGDRFTVTTGQGELVFETMGTRYAGDPAPANPRAGESRLILMTARGGPLAPVGVQYVDAMLVGEGKPRGARQTTSVTLPPQERALATDVRTVWALIFGLQFLVAAELGAIWSLRRFGWRRTWIVFVPLVGLAGLVTATQVAVLLPNLI
ncbi:sortase [Microbacterium sp. BG28]|uniref:sortase n=1 Tax=Microbacterium sp. BG28 TaxID=3097356 RepID=UPI002A59935A|nr:sortase [Microbacterium sp. BG28]MDY0830645.1 sortase [Microbacterium sp. BG28]